MMSVAATGNNKRQHPAENDNNGSSDNPPGRDDEGALKEEKENHHQQQQQEPSQQQKKTKKCLDFGAGPPHPPPRQKARALSDVYKKCRETNDEIHHLVNLDPITNAFVDTPQFQRLRELKQLGTADAVYVNCNHTRFEHSLGVAHLAATLCEKIRKHQPQLGISDKDIVCVKLAGLLHDLGHGPFSHEFEHFVQHMPEYLHNKPHLKVHYENYNLPDFKNWTHESMSLQLIDAALAYLGMEINLQDLDSPLKQIHYDPNSSIDATTLKVGRQRRQNNNDEENDVVVLTSRDFVFIKECILGKPVPEIVKEVGGGDGGGDGFLGREGNKQWLYDIVSNSHTGLDVDKMDYFARDARRALGEAGNVTDLIDYGFVAWGECALTGCKCEHRIGKDGKPQHLMICYPEKRATSAIDCCTKRSKLHTNIYLHKTVEATKLMVLNILCLADPYIRIRVPSSVSSTNNRQGQPKREYDSLPPSHGMALTSVYLEMTDNILSIIRYSDKPELAPAQELLRRLNSSRDLYMLAGEKTINMEDEREKELWLKPVQEIHEEMLNMRGRHGDMMLEKDEFTVHKSSIHHGSKNESFFNRMRFFPKTSEPHLENPIDELPVAVAPDEAKYGLYIPRKYQANIIRVYSHKSCRSTKDLLGHTFEQYIESMLGGHNMEMTMLLDENNGDDSDEYGDNNNNHHQQQQCALLSQEEYDETFNDDGNDGDGHNDLSIDETNNNDHNNGRSPVVQGGGVAMGGGGGGGGGGNNNNNDNNNNFNNLRSPSANNNNATGHITPPAPQRRL